MKTDVERKQIIDAVKFDGGIVEVILRDATTLEIFSRKFMNIEALEKTLETGLVFLWSRTRNNLWLVGEFSGNTMRVISARLNCDRDCLLLQVSFQGKSFCYKLDENGKAERTCFNKLLFEA
jgi:phosphoribosyl-AMP cyclohydrolase